MRNTQEKIASRLEQAFADHGFAEIGVDRLRDLTDVSLRTLYKYCPSRESMVLTALEYRHNRYLQYLLAPLPDTTDNKLNVILERVGNWMRDNAPTGCLFHSAVAAHPESASLRAMLLRHKQEVAKGISDMTGLTEHTNELLLIHEGLIHSWPLTLEQSVIIAQTLAAHSFNQ